MITTVQTIEKLKSLFLEIFLNKTTKVSDISDNSILNATSYGVAKVAQKCLKDIALVESHILPNSASGSYLDKSAALFGATPRNTVPSSSSTFIRIIAAPGTQYVAGVHTFNNYNGIQFRLISDITIGDLGWGYAAIRSINSGANTNADPNSIITVNPEPVGHIGCINEYRATGGADAESDELFRIRVNEHNNVLARGTLSYLTEVLRTLNGDILRVINLGNNEVGKRELALVFSNGQSLNPTELSNLLEQLTPYLSITDVNVFGNSIGISLVNIEWDYIDLDFRVQLNSTYDADLVRKQIQVNLTKYLDFRFWDNSKKVEWDDLLQVVKGTEGVKYVPDNFFNPRTDKTVPYYKLPRIRGFVMKNLDGDLISDNNNYILPIYYPVS